MHLKSLSINNLYGTLNLHLTFFDDLSLLVGINGSGKTSALSVIDWLLTPNLPKLAVNLFDRLALKLELRGEVYEIIATRSENEVLIYIECAHDKFDPISININSNDPSHDDEDRYRGLRPEEHEIKAWNFLNDLKKPTVVSLERTITAEVEDEVYYERHQPRSRRSMKRRTTPLSHIQEVFGQRYAEYRKIARENDSHLKSRIILTALHSPDFDEPAFKKFQMPQESTEQLESKVKGYLAASISQENVEIHVSRFFNYFRSLSLEVEKSADKSGKVVDLIQSQFSRVEQLARAFNEFEESNALAFKRLSQYLNAVNLFLKDSGKMIHADDSRGRLVFTELKDGSPVGPYRPIEKLSSGETQIIILFALMAFEASANSVFIVDEPEISLHPKWQTDFMKSFLELCPSNAQVLVATHSPEIVAGRKSYCVFF